MLSPTSLIVSTPVLISLIILIIIVVIVSILIIWSHVIICGKVEIKFSVVDAKEIVGCCVILWVFRHSSALPILHDGVSLALHILNLLSVVEQGFQEFVIILLRVLRLQKFIISLSELFFGGKHLELDAKQQVFAQEYHGDSHVN